MNPKIAFLVYRALKVRAKKKDQSFDGNYNIGANVIIDVLKREGIEVGFCTPETAKNFDIVLISFTSTFDIISFYKKVVFLPSWQPKTRTFKVIGGGAGMQNPTSIRHYIDYAVFGRAEDIIVDLVRNVIDRNLFALECVMNLPDIYPVKINQVDKVYPYKLAIKDLQGDDFKETFIGCANKCLFCHYTWSRKHIGDTHFVQGNLNKKTVSEILWKDIKTINVKRTKTIVAIDGYSERLRFAFGKHITNQEIIEGIEHMGSFSGKIMLYIYNISNFPTETEEDRQELYETFKKANPKHDVFISLHNTAFRPTPITPMQYAPVSLYPNMSLNFAKPIFQKNNLRAMFALRCESPWTQLMEVITIRATKDTDKIFHAISTNPKLQTGKAEDLIRLMRKNFDLTPYLKEYAKGEAHPMDFLESYTPKEKLYGIWKKGKEKVCCD